MVSITSAFKLRWIFLVVMILWNLSGVLTGIYSSAMYWHNTGDYEPLMDNTAGRVFSADVSIKKSTSILLEENVPLEMIDYFRQRIIQDIILMLLFYLILYYIVKQLIKLTFAISNEQFSPRHSIFTHLLTMVFFILILEFYSVVFIGGWHNPVGGILDMSKNFSEVWGSGDNVIKNLDAVINNNENNTINYLNNTLS